MSDEISIQFSRFSASYSPLIATMAGGFLAAEGFRPKHSVAPPGKSQRPPVVHFVQINEKDGFFLTARTADPASSWDRLKGKRVLVDHGGQPLAMFKYACHRSSRRSATRSVRARSRAWRPRASGWGRMRRRTKRHPYDDVVVPPPDKP